MAANIVFLDGTSTYSKFVYPVPRQASPSSLSDHTPILNQHHRVSRPLLLPYNGELEGNRDFSRRNANLMQQVLGLVFFGSLYR